MANREKVIQGLETIRYNLRQMNHGLLADFCDDAISVLKEQEAVKPFIQISEHTGRKWLTCGACEYTIASEKESWDEINFCPKCGKPILWEGR